MATVPAFSNSNWKRSFYILWGGQAVSLVGSAVVQFALVWWMTARTQSATVLATASLMALIPNAFLSPISGVLVDRWNRRLILMYTDVMVACVTLGLAVLFRLGMVQLWHIYLALFVRSLGSIQSVAMRATTSLMVPEEYLSQVGGYNQLLNNIIRVAMPPLGALLIGVLPIQTILMIDVTTVVFGVVPLFFVKIPETAAVAQRAKFSVWSDLRAGVRYVFAWRGLLYLILMMTTVFCLLDPAFTLIPILVLKHFQGGAFHLALMNSAFSVGGLLSGLIISQVVIKKRALASFSAVAGVGLGCLMLGLAPASAFWLGLAGMTTMALMMGLSDAPMGAILQSRVEPAMQGRVFTVMSSLSSALSPVALLIAGRLADRLGVQFWFVVGGIQCVVIGLLALRIPAILAMETLEPPAQARPVADMP